MISQLKSKKRKIIVSTAITVLLVASSIALLTLIGAPRASPLISAPPPASGLSAVAGPTPGPTLLPSSALVSSAPASENGPDDITILSTPAIEGGQPVIWTQYQNNINPDGTPGTPGGPTKSDVVAYDPYTGAILRNIPVTGHVDGLTGDQSLGMIIATANEDANSTFNLINPATSTVTAFNYSPSPNLDGNGGTDSIAIVNGHIYLAHSDPSDTSQAAMYEVTLDFSTLTAYLTPVFYDNSTATNAFTGAIGHLGLTDPDTNYVMPNVSTRFGGQIAQISQGDGQIIFTQISAPYAAYLTVMNVTDNIAHNIPPIDGLAVATSNSGTLYVVDSKAGTIQALDTTGWPTGTVFVSEPNDNNNPLLGTLNLSNGVITPLANQFQSPKGLLFVPNPSS